MENTNILDFVFMGRKVREFDLEDLKTENMCRDWRNMISEEYKAAHPNISDSDLLDMQMDLKDFCSEHVEQLRILTQLRQSSAITRNMELTIRIDQLQDDRDPSMIHPFGGKPASEVITLLDMFDRAEQMTAYEFDAYDALGSDECDRQVIETLHDMFGTEFATKFYEHKEKLILRSQLEDLYAERRKLTIQIEKLEAKL